MNWDAIGAIAELVGALAVVSTLVYLAMQVRQSNLAASVSAHQEMTRQYADFTDTLLLNPNLYELYRKGRSGQEFDGELELAQFRTMLGKEAWFFSSMHFQYTNSRLSEDEWIPLKMQMIRTCNAPGYRKWWSELREEFPVRFQKLIDEEIIE